MRITYLHQYFNTPAMPGGTRSYELGRRLVAFGHEVDVVTTWRTDTPHRGWFTTHEEGLTVHWLPVPYSNTMTPLRRMRSFVAFAVAASLKTASLRSDIIFATSTPLTIAIPGLVGRLWTRRPMVFEVRDSWPKVPIDLGVLKNPVLIALARLLERAAYFGSAHVVALAPGMRDDVASTGYPSERISVIPNGCDLAAFDHPVAPTAIEGLRQSHPWVEARPVLTYLGTIGEVNDVAFVVHLAHALRMHGDPATFAVLGEGKRRSEVEDLARQLRVLGDSVHFLGPVPKSDVPAWLASSAATIMTYGGHESVFRDSVSNKFFDSIAAGKAVFANFSGYSTKVAVECGAGAILSRDVHAAASELSEKLRTGWHVRAGENARRLARERFSRDDQAVQLRDVLEAVHSKHRSERSR